MKKICYLLVILMTIGFIGCNHPQKMDLGKTDVVILKHGQMQFYDQETQKMVPYEAETDSVVNIAFDHNNHLYYTSACQQDIKLKMLDLAASNPKPTLCADWQMTLSQITDDMWNTGACTLFADKDFNKLYIMCQSPYQEAIEVEYYNVVTGKAETMSSSEFWENYDGDERYESDQFYNADKQLYYVTPEGKVSLTDKMDLMSLFDDEDCARYMHFYPLDKSPDGKQIVIKANCELGELDYGYHCVATLDGQHQSILTDSDLRSFYPEWLTDGSLIYVGSEPRPKDDPDYDEDWNNTRHCVKILAPDGTVSVTVSDAEEYYLNPLTEPVHAILEKQAPLEGFDKAVIDNGKVMFYNSTTNDSTPFDAEKYPVINGVFDDYAYYYTVAIGDELYLKEIDLSSYAASPLLYGAWGLKLSDCCSESCGKTASMEQFETIMDGYAYAVLTKMECGLDEGSCTFKNSRYFNGYTHTTTDGWPENCVARE